MKVFKGKYGWSTTFHNKLQNGEDLKLYMPVQFMRGQEPMKDSIDIEPVRWWGSCYLSKDGETKPKLFIADWREIEQVQDGFVPQNDEYKPDNMADYVAEDKPQEQLVFDTEDLPFY